MSTQGLGRDAHLPQDRDIAEQRTIVGPKTRPRPGLTTRVWKTRSWRTRVWKTRLRQTRVWKRGSGKRAYSNAGVDETQGWTHGPLYNNPTTPKQKIKQQKQATCKKTPGNQGSTTGDATGHPDQGATSSQPRRDRESTCRSRCGYHRDEQ